jgi:hypothetical protein
MKAGDKFPVTIAGETITEATVKEVNEKDNTATMLVPATLVTMSYRTHDELTPNDPAAATPEAVEGTDHVLLTDHVVKPGEPVGEGVPVPNQVSSDLSGTPVPGQEETAPTEPQTEAVPAPVPEKVEDAVEREASE